MANVASAKIVVLFEDELVLAAKTLEKFDPNSGNGKPTKEDAEKMLRACFAAIYSPDLASGKCPVTVIRAHDLMQKGGGEPSA